MLRIVCLLCIVLIHGAAVADEPAAPTVVVQSFVRAYNDHDLDSMVKLLAEDVAWQSIQGDKVVTKATNRAELLNQLAVYFNDHPNARSVLEQSFVSGSYVSVRERAFWKQDGKTLSATAVAVYETAKGRITRAWYYPAAAQP